MTITSRGYDGSVDEVAWASMSRLVGSTYCVGDVNDWAVTIGGTGTLPVTVGTGTAFGSGVMDVNGATINVNNTAPGSGSRWDTICINRVWSTNTTSVVVRTGTTSPVLSSSIHAGPGIDDDQPIALVRVTFGLSAVQEVIDLRARGGRILTFATTAALQAYSPHRAGEWGFAADTGHLWKAPAIGTWVDTMAPVWTTITLPSSATASSPVPAYCRIGGVVYIRGVWLPQGFPTYLTGGGSGPGYSLGNLPPGFRPGSNTSFPADHGFNSTSNAVRIRISTTGIIQADILGDTSAIGAGTISYPAEN